MLQNVEVLKTAPSRVVFLPGVGLPKCRLNQALHLQELVKLSLKLSLNFNISGDLNLDFYINLRCAYAGEWSKHVQRARYVDRLYDRKEKE